MKKYQVEIEREVLNDAYIVQRATVIIPADNEEEAKDKAEIIGYDLEGKTKWRVVKENKTHDIDVLPDGVKIKSVIEIP